jgi:hypothetical protein
MVNPSSASKSNPLVHIPLSFCCGEQTSHTPPLRCMWNIPQGSHLSWDIGKHALRDREDDTVLPKKRIGSAIIDWWLCATYFPCRSASSVINRGQA